MKDIDRYNQAKDNPSQFDKTLNMILSNTMQYPNSLMNRRNHRKLNHSPAMSLLKGYTMGGINGAEAMLTHDMTDMFSDFIVRNYGRTARDMFEIGFNSYYTEQNKRRRMNRTIMRNYY
jgi:hypothetical protein